MKRFIKYILALAMCTSSVSAYASDYENHWAKQYIESAVQSGVIMESNNFRPDDYITRAEFTAMIVRDKGIMLGSYPTAFFDVDENAWYFEYVAAAENKGIITGDESYNFNPDAYITRQDAAVILGRAYGVPAEIGFDLTKHKDGIYISQYALGYMTYMTNYGVISGFEDGTIRPLENVTRSQTAAMLARIKNPVQTDFETDADVGKINFKRGYPSINDTGASGGFNMSFRTDVECDIYYTVSEPGAEITEADINTYLCHAEADVQKNAFFAYEQSEVDIYIMAVGADGSKSQVKVLKNVMPLCFDRGSGTSKDPYIITNQSQLEAIGRYPKKFFALGTNIELGHDFSPIGSAYIKDSMFSGGLDGRGYTISNLSIDTNEKFAGLFAYLDGAVVKNLYVSAKTVSGMNDVGIIAGENNGGTIENCFVTGVVQAKNNNAGGIVGTNNGKIVNCASAAAIVQSSMYAGGIAGINFAEIENCASYSHTITAQMYAGGIASSNNGGTVKSCLAANMNIENMITANSGRITANLSGGVSENNYCYNKTNSFVTNSYNENTSQNGADIDWNTFFSDDFYKNNLGWDVEDVWKKSDGILLLPTPLGLGAEYDVAGLTEFTPIGISSEEELEAIHDNPHMHYILTDNITLSSPWNTVCADVDIEEGGGFSGSFNGNGYAIENFVQEYSEDVQLYGFIGVLDSGIIRNVKIKNAVIEGGRYTGGICAINRGMIEGSEFEGTITVHDTSSVVSVGSICSINYGEIENCHANMVINAYANSIAAGGICAHNEGRIAQCDSNGSISAQGMKVVSNCTVGGIVGYNAAGDIQEVFSSVKLITASDTVYAGGICGMLDTGEIYKGSAILKTSISDADGNDSKAYLGGIAGLSNGGNIVHCVTSGNIAGDHNKSYIGGITGYNVSGLVQNTYSTATLVQNGKESAAGGIVGYNESGYIMYNAALNPLIRSDGEAARVCAHSDGGSVETNYAVSEMLVNYSGAMDSMLNGIGKSSAQMKSEFFFMPVHEGGALGWSSVKYDGKENGVWTGAIENGGYYNLPLLNGVYGQHMFTTPIYIAN